jgi:hypothetical protein
MSDLDSDGEDEQLKLAIALSLQGDTAPPPISDAGIAPKTVMDLTEPDEGLAAVSKSKRSTNSTNEVASSTKVPAGITGLDRKAMEAERLARKRKATAISPPPLRSKPVNITSENSKQSKDVNASTRSGLPIRPPSPPQTKSERPRTQIASGSPFPTGVVKKTWCRGFPRQDDIKIEEVLERKDLKLAVLSSFQWDVEWLLAKIDTLNTKLIMVMQAKDESTKQLYRKDTADMPNLRLCFPSMEGQISCMHSKLMLLAHPTYLRVVVPTANLVPYDWGESGVMENSLFLIDLPRYLSGERTKVDEAPDFCKDLIYFCEAMGLQQESINSLYDFDFSATKDLAFVHTIGGVHVGETWQRTGYCGLGRAVTRLGLATEQHLEMDFISSSVGSLNVNFLLMLYLAARGDSGLKEYKCRTKKFCSEESYQEKENLIRKIVENFRLYFPTRDTVVGSRGGVDCAGPVCFSSKSYDNPSFPRKIMRDCKSTRKGLLMHNKVSLSDNVVGPQ